MCKQIISGLVIILLVSSLCLAADQAPAAKDIPAAADSNTPQDINTPADPNISADQNTSEPQEFNDIVLPAKSSEEYWIIRSYTVTELTSFFTQRRAQMKQKLSLFRKYIEQIGKTDDLLAADIKGADDPVLRAKVLGIFEGMENKKIDIPKKPYTWEELIEVGMKYVISEGYSPIDINDAELANFKDILKKNEQFCIKVRKETSDLLDIIVKGWLYLGTIDQQKGFRLYVFDQKEQEKQAIAEKRSSLNARYRDASKNQKLTEQENRWQQKQDRRQNVEDEKMSDTRERYRRQRDRYDRYSYGHDHY